MTTQTQPYRILVALQFDETGEVALQEALRVARQNAAPELHVVHVVTHDSALDFHLDKPAIEAQLDHAATRLRDQLARECAGTSFEVIAHLRAGRVMHAILQTAAEIDSDLIVLGTHQRSRLQGLLLGRVAASLLQAAHCPVLVAIPKAHVAVSDSIEPPCPDCLEVRKRTHDPAAWCARHTRVRLPMHVYSPSQTPGPASVTGS